MSAPGELPVFVRILLPRYVGHALVCSCCALSVLAASLLEFFCLGLGVRFLLLLLVRTRVASF